MGGAGASGIGGNGAGAAGGNGGNGGSASADAGSFDMANNMTGTAVGAAGIAVIAQNSGIAALVQQSVNVQANLTVSH
jgi:hypothetical protein